MGKYDLPSFLPKEMGRAYQTWLDRKAGTHFKRDKNRGNKVSTREQYKIAIHNAVIESGGKDAYTGEELDWAIIGTYDNEKSKAGRRDYKQGFGRLPTVDHVGDGLGEADFKICGWSVNDAKNDLTMEDFEKLCIAVLKQQGYTVKKNNSDGES